MTDFPIGQTTITTEPVFRPNKRRKVYRKHFEIEEGQVPEVTISTDAPEIRNGPSAAPRSKDDDAILPDSDAHSSPVSSIAEILRLRKQVRNRRGGIEFANEASQPERPSGKTTIGVNASNGDHSATSIEKTPAEIAAIVNRFAPQTGQVADVNRHMMAYIDTELGKRLERERENHRQDHIHSDYRGSPGDGQAGLNVLSGEAGWRSTIGSGRGLPTRQPATLGKLHEIDLGPDATLRNIARTEAAKKKLEGGADDESDRVGPGSRVRLGKDGKPWRGRKRRTSDDVKRDKLVEEVLRESRLDLYDDPDPTNANANDDDDSQAADDRIAEQFRREFLDAISNRHRRRPAAANSSSAAAAKAGKVGKKDDRPKGPKLGGSRSARAAMREMQEKAGGKR